MYGKIVGMRKIMDLKIGQIQEACGGKLALQKGVCPEQKVNGVTLDSRQITNGEVFVAVGGNRVDGHKFVMQAFARGASLVVTEKTPKQVEEEHGVSAEAWGSYLLVENSLQALKDMAEFYRKTLRIPFVGITGSVGKTSTKEFIAAVLGEKYSVLKTEGNYNNEIGVPLTLLRIRREHQAAVVEMGISDFGEMHRLSKMVRPDICVITNIGQCHLENLGSRDGILKAKSEIFDFMAEDGAVCLYGGDDKLRTIRQVKGKRPCFFGLGESRQEEAYATDIAGCGLWGSNALLHLKRGDGEETIRIHIPLPGRHMVINAAGAACVGMLLGLTKEEICEGVGKAAAVNGRSRLLRLKHYTLIDDCYNANPVSMRAAIDLLSMADTGKTAILGDMFELGENSDALHSETGAYAALAGIDRIYCVGENSLHMYRAALKTAKENQRVLYFRDRNQLFDALSGKKEAADRPLIPWGDTILLKASHGMKFSELIEKCFLVGEISVGNDA